ncbi:MAG: amidohydrolase family protein [Gammaproteobacteria bacterium]
MSHTEPVDTTLITAGDGVSRRQLLLSCMALAAGNLLGSSRIPAKEAISRTSAGTIDVHRHFFPPVFREASDKFLKAAFGEIPADIRNWNPAVDLESMDRNGISMAVINTSARPPEPGAVAAATYRSQAREANDYAAKMVQDHPRRFAQFGFLPMPDVDASLREIEYVLDELKAPGIGMMTSYGNRWQGNPEFAPVLEELNRRAAVVFCHPLPAACCRALMPDVAAREPVLLEFPFDTGRAVASLLLSGSFARYRAIRWIFCHCGDVVPVLSGRMRNIIAEMPAEDVAKFAPRGMDYELQRQFYDTADAAYAPSMAAIQSYIPATQIMFGTDYPYVSTEKNLQELGERHLTKSQMQAIQRGNALRLMPQLSS